MKKITFLFFLLVVQINAQTTNIPDTSFEDALILAGVDTTDAMGFPDGFIDNAEVANVQFLDVSSSNITDLTGIEAFVSLISLDVSNNGFGASFPLATVDISNNTTLQTLVCTNSFISDLLLGNNTVLESVNCRDNDIIDLDLSGTLNIKFLNAENNGLSSLDLSQHVFLQQLTLQNNQLASLKVRNTSNNILTVFNATGNLNLMCIDVDNETDALAGNGSYANWQKDTSATYSNSCSTLRVDDFINDSLELKIYPNPITTSFQIKSNVIINSIEVFNIQGKKVKTFKNAQSNYSVNELSKGIYFIKVIMNKGIITKKIIK